MPPPSESQTPRPSQLAALPTEDDVAFYREHGWWISQRVLPDEVIDVARRGADRFYRGERDGELPFAAGFEDWRATDGGALRNNEFVSLRNHEVAALVRHPIIGAIAARLAGVRSVRLLDDQLVYKEAGRDDPTTAVGWHADHAYWGTCSSDNLITAWVPFHDVDEDRSPLTVLDGSHRWEGLEHARFFKHSNLDEVAERLRPAGSAAKRVVLALKKGQISFHHCWTLHGSLPNRSAESRLAIAIHIQDEGNRYRPAFAPDGSPVHIADERLCRRLPNGDPDFSDPAVFPVLWPCTTAGLA
jgi:ectoine hydroxylase-related dioxygenase (phytanoyl-CoA dioxygenase family)